MKKTKNVTPIPETPVAESKSLRRNEVLTNFIARGVVNGGDGVDLSSLGIDPLRIKLVWTILDEKLLYAGYDAQTGEARALDLPEVKPRHLRSAFVEDRMHDYSLRGGKLFFHGHSSEKGEIVDLLIQMGAL